MRRILLASHGKLASGLKHTIDFFLGNENMITSIDAYVEQGDGYLEEIKNFIQSVESEAVIFTDIMGGSVNQQVTTEVIKSNKDIYIISGMNLPIVLSIALESQSLSDEIIQKHLRDCSPSMIEFKTLDSQSDQEDDDFFS